MIETIETEEKTVFNLKLHEELKIGNMNIVRVPGGWIYTLTYTVNYTALLGGKGATQGFISSVFVPYNNELSYNNKLSTTNEHISN